MMENLNAEQVKKALECCKSDDMTHCRECPYQTWIYCMCKMSADALSLIKELTEEKDTWEAIAKSYQKQFEDCGEDRAKLIEENERLKATKYMAYSDGRIEMLPTIQSAKADTVREMQERVKAKILEINGNLCGLLPFIDQIAKEMLEGNQ